MRRIPLIYALSSGKLYGMQQVALATILALSDEFKPIILTPAGRAADEARRLGVEVVETLLLGADETGGIVNHQTWAFATKLRHFLSRNEEIVFLGTRCMHNLVLGTLNLGYQRQVANIHMVHGGHQESRYAQKRVLNRVPFPVSIVGVSEYCRERLLAHGVRQPVHVIENFLTDKRVESISRRDPFNVAGIRRAAIISRLHPDKRIDILLECLESRPDLATITFHIYGDGPLNDQLQSRVARNKLNVIFEGYREDVVHELAKADVLIHVCPDEAFGLVILEAIAAGVPVVAPNTGAPPSIIADGESGFIFEANDAASLGRALDRLRHSGSARLNSIIVKSRLRLQTRFSEEARISDYRALIRKTLGERMIANRSL